jgi:hypothetical protein
MKLKIVRQIIQKVSSKRRYDRLDKIPIQVYQENEKKPKKESLETFKILILCNPCHGFGDIVFAMKLKNYLTSWYPETEIKIASTKAQQFKTLGEKEENLFSLKGGKSDQCRRFKKLHFVNQEGKEIPYYKADLIFVAPLQADYVPDYSDIKRLLPYSNVLNTYFFSEYNDDLNKRMDFHTGVGKDRYGMLFVKTEKSNVLPSNLKRDGYSIVYIADRDGAQKCFLDFIKMISKNKNYQKDFEVVVPEWLGKYLVNNEDDYQNKMLRRIQKYWNKIQVQFKNQESEVIFPPGDEEIKKSKTKKTLVFRADILPLPYSEMNTLFQGAVRDILVTGDQSITDVLGCCYQKKLPFYQIVPWKKNLAKELAINLPQKYLKSISTSCGSPKAIGYHPSFKVFMERWDFRKLAKGKIDAILSFLTESKNKEEIKDVKEIFLKGKSKIGIIRKLEDI